MIYAALVRTTYLVTVLVALVLLVPFVLDGVSGLMLVGLFVGLAGRAMFRLVRYQELIADERLRDAPIVASLVFVSSVLASLLLLNLVWAYWTRAGRDIELAPFVFFGMIWLALALLIAEVVLVGRRKPPRPLPRLNPF